MGTDEPPLGAEGDGAGATQLAFNATDIGDDWIRVEVGSDSLGELDNALDRGAEDYELATGAGIFDTFGRLVAPICLGELLACLGTPGPNGNPFGEPPAVGCHADGGT